MTVQKVCLWDHHVDEMVITLVHCRYGSPKYSLYVRLLNRWNSSGHGRCYRKNETLVYQKRNLDLLLLKCKVQYELQYSLCTATPSPHTKPTLFEGRERLYTGYMRYNQMETALWWSEGGWKTAVLHDTIFLAWFFGQACYSPYLLSGESFSLKENAQIKTLAQTFLRQSLPNAQGPNTWLTLVLSIRWNRSELFSNDYINNIYFVFW